MADFRRMRSYQAGSGTEQVGSTVMGIGSDIMAKTSDARYLSDITGYDITARKDWDEFNLFMEANRQDPELVMPEFKKRLPKWKKNALENSTTKRSKTAIEYNFTEQEAVWAKKTKDWVSDQHDKNITINYSVMNKENQKPKNYPSKDDLLEDIADYTDRFSDFYDTKLVNGLTQAKAESDIMDITRTKVESYLLQHGTEDEINNPNKFADDSYITTDIDGNNIFGGKQLFGADDTAKLKQNYTTQKNATDRIAKLELEARQKETLQGFDLRLADPENKNPVSVIEVNAAYKKDDLDRAGWEDTLRTLKEGPIKEDDDEALMSVNVISDDLRRRKITTSEDAYEKMKPYKSKLTSATWQGAIKALPGLETASEYSKSYFGQLDRWRKETSTDKKVMKSNPLGPTMAERNYNYNRYHKILTEFEEKNPDANPEEWDKHFRETVYKPVAEGRIKKFLGDMFHGMYPKWTTLGLISEGIKAVRGDETEEGGNMIGELREPKNVGEFEFEVQRISQSDKKAAREYYDKWSGKW